MVARLNAKGPGEFIRDRLTELPENRDFVGAMYQAYKDHLQAADYKVPCAQTMHVYVWMLKETGAIVFDGAEPSGWENSPVPPPGYLPACGMPAPRHYYRLTDPDHPAFRNLKAAWRQHRGLPTRAVPPPVRLPPATRLAPASPSAPAAPAPPPALPPASPTVVPSISLPRRFSSRSIPRLLNHLQSLADLAEAADWPAQDWPELAAEVQRLQEAAEEWRDQAQERLEAEEARDQPRDDRLEALEERAEELGALVQALEDQDLAGTLDALESIQTLPAAPPPVVVVPAPPPEPPAPTVIEAPPPRRLSERLEQEARARRPRIEAMRDEPNAQDLDRLERELLDIFDRAEDGIPGARGAERQALRELADRLVRASAAFQDIRDAGRRADMGAYLEALERLLECCPE